ncbi:hypothetical protein FQN57_000505 [Myotisia sp. PD_48]|nr:hypothetical protein FQN57_000505 [Myotisia sp. PD_48]
MPFNTIALVIEAAMTAFFTGVNHVVGNKPPKSKPRGHFSYDGGLNVIRRFMEHASNHTVEEFQAFTSRRVPASHWVKRGNIVIPPEQLVAASHILIAQLGPEGISNVGGSKWWQWRGNDPALAAEWIETKRDHKERRTRRERSKRAMLYIHGGAYYFGSVDTHRYQLQRHARKLKARVLARLLVTLRDQRVPLPAGAVLISPWVDLMHSFPSISGDHIDDYLPIGGFMQRPSMSWPPPNADEFGIITATGEKILNALNSPPVPGSMTRLEEHAIEKFFINEARATTHSAHLEQFPASHLPDARDYRRDPHMLGQLLRVDIDGAIVELKDQIHMYTTNQLLSHPLVSPAVQPSLGGLPPLLIIAGGGEALRDEQIYIAHKAANPTAYPPGVQFLDKYDPDRRILHQYKPTYVQLQVWDDICHAAPTLSFTRPAKYMYRAIAQFSAWALSRAQNTSIDIPDVSPLNSNESMDEATVRDRHQRPTPGPQFASVGKAGDPLPPFRKHMVRQRVDRSGHLYPLDDESSLPALQVPPDQVGVAKPMPVRRWLAAKEEWDTKYARTKLTVQNRRMKEVQLGLEEIAPGDRPPPSSLAARRGISISKVRKPSRISRGLCFWSSLCTSYDSKTIKRECLETSESRSRLPWSRSSRRVTNGLPRNASLTRAVTDIGQSNESDREVNTGRPAEQQPQQLTHQRPGALENAHGGLQNGYQVEPGSVYLPSYSILRNHQLNNHNTVAPDRRNQDADSASVRSIRSYEAAIEPKEPKRKANDWELESSSSHLDWGTPRESAAMASRRKTDETSKGRVDGFPLRNAARSRATTNQSQNTNANTNANANATDGLLGRTGTIKRARRGREGKEAMYNFSSIESEIPPSETEPFPPFPGNGGSQVSVAHSGYSSHYSSSDGKD